jgi:PAS domain S-box-containing protein
MKLSLRASISLGVAILIMMVFFGVQSAVVFGYFEPSLLIIEFGYGCIIAFIPLFFFALIEFVRKAKYKSQSVDDTLKAINISNALVELDLQGNILSANKVFCEIIGYSVSELKTIKHRQLVPEVSDYDYKIFWRNLQLGYANSGEFQRISKSGEPVWIYGNYNPIKDPYGEVYRVIKIASDITDKKKIEAEVAKKNSYLEHAAKILRHDMHSGINTYIPRGLSSLKRRLSEEQIKELRIEGPLKLIEEGLTHTQKVYKGVKEFTNLVKKDAQLEKTECNLKDILQSYLSSTSYEKQVVIDEMPIKLVNESLFCTAVDNLIRNGLKYNDSPTKIVRIFVENGYFVIQDNGRGMSQQDFMLWSQPYTRKEGQEEAGSGLGLNICTAIMEEHGFKIEVEKLEVGTKIKLKI